MPTAADYGATANSVYDPQAAAETTQAGASRDASKAALDTQDRNIDPAYKNAEDTLATAHSSNNANIDFRASNALDGQSSGLAGNEHNAEGNNYLKSLTQMTGEQAGKHADVASARTLADNQYASTLQGITQKYSGLKSGYVADMLNQDASKAFQQKMADQSASLQRSLAQINASSYGGNNNTPAVDPKQALHGDIMNSFQNFLVRPTGYTEKTIIPALYKQYGGQVSLGDIKSMVYDARKTLGYG